VQEIARGLGAIVVMPEAARGFYTSWWNEGRRGDPGWERFFLDELVPLVEERFRVLPGAALARGRGLSMGGMGATFLASQLPGYFGSAATFSGFVAHQRPEIPAGLRAYGARLRADLRPGRRLLRDGPQPGAADGQPPRRRASS
jgi:S-formylglutathione hydrolase FrmB